MPNEPTRDLDGKVALVVGGSRNQGAATAELIASRGATTVVSCANHQGAAERTLAAPEKHDVVAEAIRSDARRSAEVDELFDGVLARHGHLDIVVHTPGAVIKKPLADPTDPDFDHEDVAPVVGWLVGEAAGWVSGRTVRANGAMF